MNYIFPNEDLMKFDKSDVGTALFCNSFFNEEKYAGLLMVGDNALLKKINFKIYGNEVINPPYAFRMFSAKYFFIKESLFEFQILFEGAKEITKLHLKPDSNSFIEFCNETIKRKSFGVFFHNVDTKLITVLYHNLKDNDDLDWLKRNLEISKKTSSNTLISKFKNFDNFSKVVQEQSEDPSIYFLHNSKIGSFDVVREKI